MAIGDQVLPAFTELSQRITEPVWPESVIVPVLPPLQIGISVGESEPPTVVALVVTTCVVVAGPLHPAAFAVMVVVPLQPAA